MRGRGAEREGPSRIRARKAGRGRWGDVERGVPFPPGGIVLRVRILGERGESADRGASRGGNGGEASENSPRVALVDHQ